MWTAGIVMALFYRKRHPQVAFLTILVCGLSAFSTFVTPYAYTTLFAKPRTNPWMDFQTLIYLISFGHALLSACVWGLVLLAIFGWRNPATFLPPQNKQSRIDNPPRPHFVRVKSESEAQARTPRGPQHG
jgi:hypothetical protein